MTKRVVVSVLCSALWVLATGCDDECVDAFDCRNDKGLPPEGQVWVCNADNECEQRPSEEEPAPEEDAGTDAGTEGDAGTDQDAGTDAGADQDAGTDQDAGADAGSMSVGKDGTCVSSGDCMAGLRCEGTPSTCQAMHVAVTADKGGGTTKALIARFDVPGMQELTAGSTESTYPRWGPGGTRISFVQGATSSAAGELVVRDMPAASGASTVLADGGTANTESFRYMEWEPGNYIAWVRVNGSSRSGISVVPTDGGSVVEATANGTFPDWAGNGTTFAYSANAVGLLTSSVGGSPAAISGAGETAEQPHYNRTNDFILFLKPDTAKPTDFNYGLFTIAAGGGEAREIAPVSTETVTGGSVDSYIANPNWAPDGSWVAYVRAYFSNVAGTSPVLCGNASATLCPTREGNVIFLKRVTAEGSASGDEVELARGGTLPSFSPDGRYVAYIKGGQLYVQQIDPATGAASGAAIVHPKGAYTLQTGDGDDHRPRWQPK